jgi:hypothetical protein
VGLLFVVSFIVWCMLRQRVTDMGVGHAMPCHAMPCHAWSRLCAGTQGAVCITPPKDVTLTPPNPPPRHTGGAAFSHYYHTIKPTTTTHRRSRILLLDEATSSVDYETDSIIQVKKTRHHRDF